jgi:transposase
MTPKEQYQFVLDAASIDNEQLGGFLRERGLHSDHITIWDQELREMMNKKNDKKELTLRNHGKPSM